MNQDAIKLQEDLDKIYDAVAEEMGMRITYVQSMNGSLFPLLVELLEEKNLTQEEKADLISEVRFLAENDFILPKSIENACDEEFEGYILANSAEILKEIREYAEEDYYDATGKNFKG